MSPKRDAGPTLDFERQIQEEYGLSLVAGVDEAGRGAIAGPVVAAAVILPLADPARLARLTAVNDSKQLTARRREHLYDLIVTEALAYGLGATSAAAIDQLGILPANAQAMQTAVDQLSPVPDYLLIDGRMRLKNCPIPQQAIIRGDSLSLSIAAASILAKVTRDQQMVTLSQQYPHYGLAAHKGYCTRQHVAALDVHGPTPIHRHSFAPIRQTLL